MRAVTELVFGKGRSCSSVLGYAAAIRGIRVKPTATETGHVVEEVLASP